ncbi:MAG TPA: flagellin [Cellvibrio sp.]|nr:flagellin [Cellvibrio sp.]
MSLVINTNISSLGAQRQLTGSGMALDRATERLSSGQRINSAKDDAAGLSIANRMSSTVRGLDQAIRNANDGVSLIQTAEGALQESTNILQRMRELAVQSSNGIYSASDRKTLDAESKQLVAELNRIASSTAFNGQNLLDGKLGELKLQVGSEANQTISMKIGAMDAKTLGLGSLSADMSGTHFSGALASTTFADGDVLINGQSIGAFDGAATGNNLSKLLAQINSKVSGVTATAINEVTATSVGDGKTTTDGLTIALGNPDGTSSSFVITGTNNMDELVSAINTQANGAVVASKTDDGRLSLASNTGAIITMTQTNIATHSGGGITTATAVQPQLAFSSTDGSAVTVSKGTKAAAGVLASLGLQETRTNGGVVGGALNATTWTYGDVKINGVAISADNSNTLQGKVNNINAASSQTGVTATLKAESTSGFTAGKIFNELTGTTVPASANTAGDDIQINGFTVTSTGTTIKSFASDINAAAANTGVYAYVDSADNLHLFSEGQINIATGTNGAGNLETFTGLTVGNNTAASVNAGTGSMRLNNTVVDFAAGDLATSAKAAAKINTYQATTGVYATVNDQGALVLNSNASFNIEVGDTNGAATLAVLGLNTAVGGSATAGAFGGTASGFGDGVQQVAAGLQLSSTNGTPISIDLTAAGATNSGLLKQNVSASGVGFGSSVSSLSIATQEGAQKAIKVLDLALTTINDTRASLGAINNRLDFTVANLTTTSEKTSAARSRIMDADFATETSSLSRATVLQQAASAMLAQSNARPQQVLSLLR